MGDFTLLLSFSVILCMAHAGRVVPGLVPESYTQEGDLNIGILLYAHKYSASDWCGAEFWEVGFERAEVVKFIIDQINADHDILPNITLGFVAVDECRKDLTALGRSVHLVMGSTDRTCPIETKTSRGIVGVVGPSSSRQAVMVASFLSIFQIPIIGTTSTSDELSDKSRFPYFSRLVPPDRFQAEAIVDILMHFRWSYVSLLYSEGSYGENAEKHIVRLVKNKGICLGYSHRISSDATDSEFELVVDKLLEHHKAKAVIMFLSPRHIEGVFGNLKGRNATNKIVFVSSDVFMALGDLANNSVAAGSLYLGHPSGQVPGFLSYYHNLMWNSTANPWVRAMWENKFQCSWKGNSSKAKCESYTSLGQAVDNSVTWTLSKSAEGILVYAHALHNLITSECPEAFIDKSLLDNCIRGPRLLQHLRDVEVDGYMGKITFDEKGDMLGNYWVHTVKINLSTGGIDMPAIGEWNKLENKLTINEAIIDWSKVEGVVEENDTTSLASVCSVPCGPRQYRLVLEPTCCWECRSCRENEYILNNTACEECPRATWPDGNATGCEHIAPTYMLWSDPIGVGLLSLSGLGVVITVAVAGVYIRHRNCKLVKASSRELSAVILGGMLAAAIGVACYVARPSTGTCVIRRLCFHLSVNLIYAPMMLKTYRIYRVFTSSRSTTSRPRFTSSVAMMGLAAAVVSVQVVILVISELVEPSELELRVPVRTQRYVELTCGSAPWTLFLPLSYNIAIIALCAILGFLTRRLPENFNESWYIFVSVITTLFMWVVFFPSYFSAFYSHHQVALLSLCLVISVYVSLCGQFVPKAYAIYFVDEKKIKFVNMATTNSTQVHPEPQNSSTGGAQCANIGHRPTHSAIGAHPHSDLPTIG